MQVEWKSAWNSKASSKHMWIRDLHGKVYGNHANVAHQECMWISERSEIDACGVNEHRRILTPAVSICMWNTEDMLRNKGKRRWKRMSSGTRGGIESSWVGSQVSQACEIYRTAELRRFAQKGMGNKWKHTGHRKAF